MTKAELVAVMARAAGAPKRSAEKAMGAFVDALFESLRTQRRVTSAASGPSW